MTAAHSVSDLIELRPLQILVNPKCGTAVDGMSLPLYL